MSFIQSILPAILVLGALITIHEFGHFLACRLTKVKVEKFSIGFGPEIFHWQSKETRYAISLFPLGGFVKPAGESIGEIEEQQPKEGDYLNASIWARIFIVSAGVIMNYALAFVLFVGIALMGRPVPGTTIGGFVDDYPAKESGMLVEDEIMSIDGKEVETWIEMTEALGESSNKVLNILVNRGGKIISINIAPKIETIPDVFGDAVEVKRLGVTPHPKAQKFEKFGPLEAVREGWNTLSFFTVNTHKAIFYLMLGKMSMKSLSGPVGIINMTGTAAKMGLPYLLNLAAILSVSLAVLNLLPIPALDGGHLLFLLVEVFTRKRVSLVIQERATQVGFFLLLTLMVFVIYSDLAKLDFFNKMTRVFTGG